MKKVHTGKIYDYYELNENFLIMVSSNHSYIKNLKLNNKAVILNEMSRFWFEKTSDIFSNHMANMGILKLPDDFNKEKYENQYLIVKKLSMIPYMFIIKGYKTSLRDFKEELNDKLPSPTIIILRHNPNGNNIYVSHNEFSKEVGTYLKNFLFNIVIDIYEYAYSYALSKNIILASTKFEFGSTKNGELVLGSDLLTPNSSTYWLLENNKIRLLSFNEQDIINYIKHNKQTIKKINDNKIKQIEDNYNILYSHITDSDIKELKKSKK